jgi:dTDP-4-amino-4,6-dideoxygalactose transaminase
MSGKIIGKIPITRPHLPAREALTSIVEELFETRMLSNFGKYTQLLERRAAAALGNPLTLSVSSCDIGMLLAWQALDCPPSEVIVPSFTFCSTVNTLRWNGLVPVFAEIDPDTYCIDVEDVRRQITPRTVGISAVHVFGLPAAIEPLEHLANEHGLKLVFDAAHGLGGRYRDTPLGAFGDASAFSMSGTKLVTSGEGGLITFRDPAVAERFSFLRVYGFKADYNCRYVGLNGKLSELNAALGWLSLELLDAARSRRHEQVGRYRDALADCSSITWQEVPADCVHGYKDLAIRFHTPAERTAVEAALAAAGVMTKRYFFPVHRMDAYRSYVRRPLPATDYLYDRVLCIPLYHDLSDQAIDAIAGMIRTAQRQAARQHFAA